MNLFQKFLFDNSNEVILSFNKSIDKRADCNAPYIAAYTWSLHKNK